MVRTGHYHFGITRPYRHCPNLTDSADSQTDSTDWSICEIGTCNRRNQAAIRTPPPYRSTRIRPGGQKITIALPINSGSGTKPQNRLSCEAAELSPSTK